MELTVLIIVFGLLLMIGAIVVVKRMPARYPPGIPDQIEQIRKEREANKEIARLKEGVRKEIEELKKSMESDRTG